MHDFDALMADAGMCSERPAVVANMSARVGSLADNRLGGVVLLQSQQDCSESADQVHVLGAGP